MLKISRVILSVTLLTSLSVLPFAQIRWVFILVVRGLSCSTSDLKKPTDICEIFYKVSFFLKDFGLISKWDGWLQLWNSHLGFFRTVSCAILELQKWEISGVWSPMKSSMFLIKKQGFLSWWCFNLAVRSAIPDRDSICAKTKTMMGQLMSMQVILPWLSASFSSGFLEKIFKIRILKNNNEEECYKVSAYTIFFICRIAFLLCRLACCGGQAVSIQEDPGQPRFHSFTKKTEILRQYSKLNSKENHEY